MFSPLRVVSTLASIVLVFILFVFLIVDSSLFREARIGFVEKRLEKVLNIPVVIDGDVTIGFDPEISLVATQVRIPSETIDSVDLVSLQVLQLALIPKRGLMFPSIHAEELTVDLIKNKDGVLSWRQSKPAKGDINSASSEVMDFLGKRDVTVSDFKLVKSDEKSGFEFDFSLSDFDIEQSDGGAQTALDTQGKLNGQDFDVKGDFPKGDQFKLSGAAGDLDFSMQGKKSDNGTAGDFAGELTLKSGDLQNLLDVLKLEANIDGTGSVKANLTKTSSLIELTSIDAQLDLASGNTIALSGKVSEDPINAPSMPDFDLNITVGFADAADAPKTAVYFTDIRPETLALHIIGADGKWTIEQLELDTNAFDEALQKIGPFHGAVIERSSDGHLQVTGIAFHIGPDDDPVAKITGKIGDLLDFREYTFQGELDLPARTLLPDIPKASAEELGKLSGSFKLSDDNGSPILSHFSVESKDTKIWSAKFSMDVADLSEPSSWEIDASFDVPNGTNFLKAMQMKPVATGAIHYSTKISFAEDSVEAISDVAVGSTSIHSDLTLGVENNAPRLTGKIQSPEARLRDFRNAVQLGSELSALGKDFDALLVRRSDVGLTDSVEGVWSDLQKNSKEETSKKTAADDTEQKIAIKDVVNLNNLLESNFLAVDVTVDKLSGIPGLSKVDSKLTGRKGNVTLAPLNLALGDGRASVSAGVDLVKSPKRVSVGGKGSGWDLGDVIKEAGAKIAADGDIHAQFNVSGRYVSPKDFLDTLQGDAKIGLENGEIGTSLIELSGLGVLPWLFSKELANGASAISCMRAQLNFDDGKVTLEELVLETRRVQLVATGTVDYVKDTIDIQANPRGLGHPLSRSAWPFTVTGSLQHPKIKAHFGRIRRWSPQVLEMPAHRVPCVPDVQQLKPVPASQP